MLDELGDRMKMYEEKEAGRMCIPLLPICIRIDGKNFSKWTKDLTKPFDERLSRLMIETTKYLVEETGACVGYTQSDEISLILYSDSIDSQVFFNGKIQKINSIVASMTTAYFNSNVGAFLHLRFCKVAYFDCRIWNVPTLEEAANVLVWREQDATRNSISMAAQCNYSHKELQNKNCSDMQEMLFQKGINWNDYPDFFKRGTYIQRKKVFRLLTESEKQKIPEKFWPTEPVERTEIKELAMPKITSIINRVDVFINGNEPKVK